MRATLTPTKFEAAWVTGSTLALKQEPFEPEGVLGVDLGIVNLVADIEGGYEKFQHNQPTYRKTDLRQGRRKGFPLVTNASSHKWKRYEQALLVAMGFDRFPTSANTTAYQLLILPSFRAHCCLRLVLSQSDGELGFSLLVAHSAELFDAIWHEDDQAEEQAIGVARRACLEDLIELNAEQVATLRARLSALEPMILGDVALAARDGVSIRCDCCEQSRHHSFRMQSPTLQEAPRHTRLIRLVLEAAQAHFAVI
jgi:hypothetical protein